MGSQAPLKPNSILPKHILGSAKLRSSGPVMTYASRAPLTQERELVRCLVAASGSGMMLSGNQTIDGLAVPEGSAVLAFDRSVAAENGLYSTSSGPWVRLYGPDAVIEMLVHVTAGTLYGGRWFSTVDGAAFTMLATEGDLTAHASDMASMIGHGHVRIDGQTISIGVAGTISTVDDKTVQRLRFSSNGMSCGVPRPELNLNAIGPLAWSFTNDEANNRLDATLTCSAITGSGMASTLPVWTSTGAIGASRVLHQSVHGVVEIPWEATDTRTTLRVGSGAIGNSRSALEAFSGTGTAIYGEVNWGGAAVRGFNGVNSTTGTLGHAISGVRGEVDSASYLGVHGINPSGIAVMGETVSGDGVYGSSAGAGAGVRGYSSGTGPGLVGSSSWTGPGVRASSERGPAGLFTNSNATNTSPTVSITSSAGSAESLLVTNSASGRAANFQITNTASNASALTVATAGTGGAATFSSTSGICMRIDSTSGVCLSVGGTGTGHVAYLYRNSSGAGPDQRSILTAEQGSTSCAAAAVHAIQSGTGPALRADGQIELAYRAVTGAVMLSERDVIAAVTSVTAPYAVTLPSAASCSHRWLLIKDETGVVNSTTRLVTITASGTNTIDGAPTKPLSTPYGRLLLYSNGTNWLTW